MGRLATSMVGQAPWAGASPASRTEAGPDDGQLGAGLLRMERQVTCHEPNLAASLALGPPEASLLIKLARPTAWRECGPAGRIVFSVSVKAF